MKNAITLMMALFTLNASASPVDCYRDSRIDNLNKDETIRLCKGGDDRAPVDCYRDSRIDNLNKEESIALCSGARRSYNPVDCYRDNRIENLDKFASINLCSAK